MKTPIAVLAVALAAISASSLRAQVTGATVVGKVTDSKGAAVSNALVDIKVKTWENATPSQKIFKEIRMEQAPQMSKAGSDGGGWSNWSYE